MTVSAPSRPPTRPAVADTSAIGVEAWVDELFAALIEEARQTARRRRRAYGLAALVAAAVGIAASIAFGRVDASGLLPGSESADVAVSETLRDAEIILTAHDAAGVGSAVRWTTDGIEDLGVGGWAVGLSPDGSRLLVADDTARDGLTIVGIDGDLVASVPHAGSGDGMGETAVWSPDGSRIAFAAPPGFSTMYTERYRRLFVMDADGTNRRSLPGYYVLGGPPFAGNVSWSPDGSAIAFAGLDSASSPDDRALYVTDGDGLGPVRRITIADADVQRPSQPAWSPDGSRIAFTAMDKRGSRALYAMSATGDDVRRIATGGHDAVWSPDGTMVAFRSGDRHWTIRADGTALTALPRGVAGGLSWSPDSAMLVYTAGRYGRRVGGEDRVFLGADVFVIRGDGREGEESSTPSTRRTHRPGGEAALRAVGPTSHREPDARVAVALRVAALVASSVVLVGCGSDGAENAATATSTNAGDPAAPTIDGRFPVDEDQRKLAIRCWGDGSPTVVVDAGSGSPGILEFEQQSIVRNLVGRTRVCLFDRAGLGTSDAAPVRKRGLDDAVDDLHALLGAAAVPRPYVLVGESGGGFNVYHHAGRYPDEVAGLVLLDVPAGQANIPAAAVPAWNAPSNPEHMDYAAIERRMALDRLPIPAIPVTVITASAGQSADPSEQRVWLEGSSDPVHVVLDGGHGISVDDPEGVLAEITKVVDRAASG